MEVEFLLAGYGLTIFGGRVEGPLLDDCDDVFVDTVAEWGFNDEPAYPIVFKKGLPWEQPET